MKIIAGLVVAASMATSIPAYAQYHYSYGTSRVTNQNQTGLFTPSATYIGAGTMSQSAQGKAAGVGGLLPSVNMGAHVRTPGDNMYNGDGSDRMNNGALIYQDQMQAIMARKAAIIRRRQMREQRARQMQMRQQQQGNVYIPGSNGASASYANSSGQMQYNRNGNATYGDSYSGSSSSRKF